MPEEVLSSIRTDENSASLKIEGQMRENFEGAVICLDSVSGSSPAGAARDSDWKTGPWENFSPELNNIQPSDGSYED